MNQCSGNSRGFFQPRVGGGQLGNGAMGNAKMDGRSAQGRAGKGRREARARSRSSFNGLDTPVDGEDARLHQGARRGSRARRRSAARLRDERRADCRCSMASRCASSCRATSAPIGSSTQRNHRRPTRTFDGFWMTTAYRIPIHAQRVRSRRARRRRRPSPSAFQCALLHHEPRRWRHRSPSDSATTDARHRLRRRARHHAKCCSPPTAGNSWRAAQLGEDLGRYSFREWTHSL